MNQWKGRAKVFSLMLFVLFLWAGLQPGLSLGQKAEADEKAHTPNISVKEWVEFSTPMIVIPMGAPASDSPPAAPEIVPSGNPKKVYQRALAAIAGKDYSTALQNIDILDDEASSMGSTEENEAAQYAIELCKKIIQAKTDNLIHARAYYHLGMAYYHTGQDNKAVEAAIEAVRLAPDDRNCLCHLSHLYLMANNYGQAILCLEKALSIPRPVFRFRGDYDRQAIQAYLDNLDADTYSSLGFAYYRLGQLKQAIKALEKSVEIDPNDIIVYYYLGWAYFENKDYESAKVALLKALQLPEDRHLVYSPFFYALGLVYGKLGKPDEAGEAYKKALELDKDNAGALNNLGALYDNRGNNVMAADYYYRAGILFLKQNDRDGALLALDNLSNTGSPLYEKLYSEVYPDMPLKEKRKKK
ncbi:MAG: tetratricopeptide repeat protein [Candidatus Subteraquimicrobiales bacterium]|nr:tetratricopeptide repeat protein [Candidatus Subteraquimicrobiales bacterium]